MNDLSHSKSAQTFANARRTSPVVAPKRNTHFIWPAALVISGVVVTFAWVIFLGWFLWKLFF
jgi:hypothetical protein